MTTDKLKKFFSSKGFLIGVAGFVVLFATLWVTLPHIAEHYLNKALNNVEGYRGSVGSVGLHHIFRGVFVIHDVDIRKQNGEVLLPFMSVKRMDGSIQWSQLFRGHIVATAKVYSPRMNFVHGPTKEKSQLEVDKGWQDVAKELTPIEVNHFEVVDGEVHFVSVGRKPDVDMYVKNLNVVAKNLTNSQDKSQKLFSSIVVSGETIGNGKVEASVQADPLTKPLPTFNMKSAVTGMDLPALNKFLMSYGGFDVNKGKFDLFFEIKSTPTHYKGYVKPMISHIDVLDWEKDSKRLSFIQVVWKAIVGTVASVLENQPKDRIATEAPFEGTWKSTDVNVFETMLNLLRNAFVQALVPGFGRTSK